uniref:HAT C-terminal dimerisation domain-containing protein n=1 Tax=Latimeria chalumnae TaxID=7897 RepID=H3B901_LATCH
TGGAPNMRGKEKGLLGLMRKQNSLFHCIIHQEALVSKLKNGEMQIVMQLVVKVVNFIVSRALNHKLIADYEAECGELVMHNEVRWWSRGRVLEKFLGLLPLIHEFLESKGKGEKELEDPGWIIKLSFLTDIMRHLNALSLQLQGKRKLPSDMLRVVTAFQCKITTLFIPDLCSNCFVHFPKLKSVTSDNPDLLSHYQYKSFVCILEELREEFESRFKDVREYKELFNFIENPFHESVSSLSLVLTDLGANRAKVESKIVEIQMDGIMKSELKAGVYHFWNMVPDAQKVLSIFVSTYTCESTFSTMLTMNIVKRKQRNKLTNEHLDCITRIAMMDYKYCMKKKVKEQKTHFRS